MPPGADRKADPGAELQFRRSFGGRSGWPPLVEVVGHLREAVWSCFVLNKLFFWEEKSLKVWVQA